MPRIVNWSIALLLLGLPFEAALAGNLSQVGSFGSNPGALAMYQDVPDTVPDGPRPLVVLLHGCSQQVSTFQSTGFNELAEDFGFYVVYPQQGFDNNPVQCFNWAGEYGNEANLERGKGENQSVVSMVEKMKADHDIDDDRVFAVGFSAGAAMANVLLATWPDVFAGGAIMSGVPYRCATTVQGAYDCMAINAHQERKKDPAAWGDLVLDAFPGYSGPYPKVVLFHGTSDFTVHSDNLSELVEQWTDVHGTGQTPASTAKVAGHEMTTYTNQAGVPLVRAFRVGGMGHSVSIGASDPAYPCGQSGMYVTDKGLCAAYHAADFLGLTGGGGPVVTEDTGPAPDAAGTPDNGGAPDTAGTVDAGVAWDTLNPGTPKDTGQTGGGAEGLPIVSIVNPAEGATLAGAVTVEAFANDDDGILRVEFYVDDVLKASSGQAPFTWLWPTAVYTDGLHVLKVAAYDSIDNSAETAVTVNVANAASAGIDGASTGNPAADVEAEHHDPIPFWSCSAGSSAPQPYGLLALLLLALGLPALRPTIRRRLKKRASRYRTCAPSSPPIAR